jgi:hypothetical protein
MAYALYSVFNKTGMRRYDGGMVLAYKLLAGCVFLAPLQSPGLLMAALRQLSAVA